MSYGKFEKIEDLVEGYNNLEREFTKKCQQLKQLQSGISSVEPPQCCNASNPEDMTAKVVEYLLAYGLPEKLVEADNLARMVDNNSKVTDGIFELYLNRCLCVPTVMSRGGYTAIAPQSKPKNIAEASKMSKHFFK